MEWVKVLIGERKSNVPSIPSLSGLYDAIDAVLSLQDQVETKEFFNSVHELLKQFKQ